MKSPFTKTQAREIILEILCREYPTMEEDFKELINEIVDALYS